MGTPGERKEFHAISESSRVEELADLQDLDLEDHRFANHSSDHATSVATAANQVSAGVKYEEGTLEHKCDDFIDEYNAYYSQDKQQTASIANAKVSVNQDAHAAGPSGLHTPTTSPSETKMRITGKKPKKQVVRKQHVCNVCQKCFQNPNKLGKHQQVHGINSPFKCEHCKKSFSSKFKLVRHVLIHSDRKPFSCTICERTFHRKDHLKNHIKVHSPCKKLYACETCKKEYTSSISYRKHLAFHAADAGQLDCLICEQTFASKDEILYHLKVHAGSRTVKNPDEKKYSCDHCERKFFTRKDVRRHMVVHTGRRDFLCQFCPQRFGRKDHLVRHIKKSHTKESGDDASAGLSASMKTEVPEAAAESSVIKVECDDEDGDEAKSNLSDAELNIDLDSLLALPATQYLPEAHTQGELADLGCAVLDAIPEVDNLITFLSEDAPETLRENAPLPAFSQIFQQSQPQQQSSLRQPPSSAR